jgi:hypothetical protein
MAGKPSILGELLKQALARGASMAGHVPAERLRDCPSVRAAGPRGFQTFPGTIVVPGLYTTTRPGRSMSPRRHTCRGIPSPGPCGMPLTGEKTVMRENRSLLRRSGWRSDPSVVFGFRFMRQVSTLFSGRHTVPFSPHDLYLPDDEQAPLIPVQADRCPVCLLVHDLPEPGFIE